MLVRLGHPVKKLRRVALGPLKLKGVASGQWRALTQAEVRSLRRAAGAARKQIDR
jgi:23S rRNA pseudouridine2605 synthase